MTSILPEARLTNAVSRAATAAALRPYAQRCKLCGTENDAAPVAICENCLGPLEPLYPANRRLPDRATIAARPQSLWRYREWLPFEGEPVASLDTGFSPLIDAPRLADKLGVARVWVKNDAVSHPSLSFKDRVVSTAINAAIAFGLDTVGCASTGNLANAVAAHAARAGLASWIFIPEDLEIGKVIGTAVYGPNLVRIKGHYDDVNRLCAQLADRFGWGIVNVNLRGYYGEGSKTMAFEIARAARLAHAERGRRADGGRLARDEARQGIQGVHRRGARDGATPRVYGTQASGCAPIVRLWERGDSTLVPEIPNTIARSIAIGNPADGAFAAKVMRESGGRGAARERRSARRRHPAARRDDRRVHRDGGWRDGCRCARARRSGALPFRRRDCTVHHGQRIEDDRSGE